MRKFILKGHQTGICKFAKIREPELITSKKIFGSECLDSPISITPQRFACQGVCAGNPNLLNIVSAARFEVENSICP
jgi:hypothetical protein